MRLFCDFQTQWRWVLLGQIKRLRIQSKWNKPQKVKHWGERKTIENFNFRPCLLQVSEVGSPPHIPLLSCGCSSAALLPLGAVLENCSKNINSHEGQSAGDHIKQFFDSPKPAGDQQIEKLYQESQNSILPFKFFSRQEIQKNETRRKWLDNKRRNLINGLSTSIFWHKRGEVMIHDWIFWQPLKVTKIIQNVSRWRF